MRGTDRGQTNLDFALGVSVFLLTVVFVFSFVPGMLDPFTASTQQETAASDRIADQLAQEMLVSAPGEPYRLDRECTVIFFETNDVGDDDGENTNGDGDYGDPFSKADDYAAPCNFPDLDLDGRLGTAGEMNVHISLRRDLTTGESDNPDDDGDDVDDAEDTDDEVPTSLCLDANNPRITEVDRPLGGACDPEGTVDDDVLFEIGPTPPDGTGSVVVSRRFVHVEGGFADGTSDAMLVVEVW
jgi:hypothetical protein